MTKKRIDASPSNVILCKDCLAKTSDNACMYAALPIFPEDWCNHAWKEIIEDPWQSVIDIAMGQIGTIEGPNNDNPYAKWFDTFYPKFYHCNPINHYAWCGIFVNWCFAQAYGFENMLKLNCCPETNSGSCQVADAFNYYVKAGRMAHGKDPRPGDQVFYGKNHTEIIVERVDSINYWTVGGNAGPATDRVYYKKHNYWEASGWGRPDWSLVA